MITWEELRNESGCDCVLCRNCIDAIKSRGEKIYVGPLFLGAEEVEEMGGACEWCGEIDDLYETN